MISGFSIISAAFFYSVFLFMISLLRGITPLMKRGGVSILMVLATFDVLRLVVPIEIPATRTIRSWKVFGQVQRYLRDHDDVVRLLLVIWAIGAVICVSLSIISLCRAYKRCRSYTAIDDDAVQEIARRLSISCPVVVSPDVEIPYVVGFLHHTIYFPVPDFPEDELPREKTIELALAHEAQHIRSGDALIKLVFGLVAVSMWWNPFVHLSWGTIDALLEMRCDRNVTKDMDGRSRCAYGEMLKIIAKRAVDRRRTPVLALNESPVLGKKDSVLKQRVEVVINKKADLPLAFRAALYCMMALLFCMSYLAVVQGAVAPDKENFQNDLRTSYDEEYEGSELGDGANNSFIIKGSDGRYQLFVDYRFIKYLSEDEVLSDKYEDLLIVEENRQR